MKRIILTMLCLSLLITGVEAKKAASKTDNDSVKLTQVIDTQYVRMLQDTIVEQRQMLQLKSDSVSTMAESLSLMTDSVTSLMDSIKALNSFMASADSVFVRFAILPLKEDFDSAKIKSAIAMYNKIKSPALQKSVSILLTLLKEYEPALKAFKDILYKAQIDQDRILISANASAYKNKYINLIKSMDYYKKYYKQNWSVRKLDADIDDAIRRLNKHTADDPVDFEDIINR